MNKFTNTVPKVFKTEKIEYTLKFYVVNLVIRQNEIPP